MAAIVNGLSLSKLRAFGATFFIFSDYARPAIRLSALMELPTIFVFTHDAMGDGEDGPTHQPVEQLLSLRAIPGLVMLRPGDANEVVEAYRYIMQLRHQPAVLALSRQPLPTLDRSKYALGVRRRARRLCAGRRRRAARPRSSSSRSGSEVALIVEAHETLTAKGSARGWSRCRPGTSSSISRRTIATGAAAGRHGAGRHRAGLDVRLGALCRRPGPGHRHEDLRRLGAAQGVAAQFGFEPDKVVAAALEMLGRK